MCDSYSNLTCYTQSLHSFSALFVFIVSLSSSSSLSWCEQHKLMAPGDSEVMAVPCVHIHPTINHPMQLGLIGPRLLPDDAADKRGQEPSVRLPTWYYVVIKHNSPQLLGLYLAPLSHYRMLDVYRVSWLMLMLRRILDWWMLIGYMILIYEWNYGIWWRQWGLRGSAWLWYHIKHVIWLCCVRETSVCQRNST